MGDRAAAADLRTTHMGYRQKRDARIEEWDRREVQKRPKPLDQRRVFIEEGWGEGSSPRNSDSHKLR
jgi:hypothetical protein